MLHRSIAKPRPRRNAEGNFYAENRVMEATLLRRRFRRSPPDHGPNCDGMLGRNARQGKGDVRQTAGARTRLRPGQGPARKDRSEDPRDQRRKPMA